MRGQSAFWLNPCAFQNVEESRSYGIEAECSFRDFTRIAARVDRNSMSLIRCNTTDTNVAVSPGVTVIPADALLIMRAAGLVSSIARTVGLPAHR